MKKLLIISPAFPPINTADLHRVRMSLPHYRENDWEPVVLCIKPSHHESPREDALLRTIPGDIRIIECSALPLRLCRLFGVGNLGLRCLAHLFFAGLHAIRHEKPDLVFFSTTQFALFPLGRAWLGLTGVPYVIDLHDPWVSDAYSKPGAPRPPGGWKYRFADLYARRMEAWSFRKLSGFMAVSQGYIDDLRARYSWFGAIPSAAIGFGASKRDFAISQEAVSHQEKKTDPAPIHTLLYTGASGPSLNRIIPEFLDGLACLKQRDPAAARRLCVEFVGTSYVTAGSGKPSVLPLAEKRGLATLVRETPHRLGHLESLALQRRCDILLLLGSTDPAYSPSKLYNYFLAGKPILALAAPNSTLARLLLRLNCGHLITIDSESPEGSQAGRIADALACIAHGRAIEDCSTRDTQFFNSEFLACSLVQRQCGLFEAALNSAHKVPSSSLA